MALHQVPASQEARNLAERLRGNGASCFRFISTPGIEPTNNLAAQAIRFVVIDRHITQGTRGENGGHPHGLIDRKPIADFIQQHVRLEGDVEGVSWAYAYHSN